MRISLRIGQSILFFAYVTQIFLGIFWIAGNIGGTPIRIICVLLQLLIAYGAGLILIGECMKRYFRGTEVVHQTFLSHFGALAFVTIPQCMQCHLTLSRQSISGSLLLIVVAEYLELHEMTYMEEEQKKKKTGTRLQLFLGWFLMTLFQPFYGLLLFPVVLTEVVQLWRQQSSTNFSEKNRERRVFYTILLIAQCILIIGGHGLTPAALRKQIAANAVSRFSYTHFEQDYDAYSGAVQSAVSPELARSVGHQSDGIETLLVPALEHRANGEQTEDLLWSIAGVGISEHRSENIKQILWDILGYQFPAFVIPMQLRGRAYEALTGYRYGWFIRRTPKLGAFIVRGYPVIAILFLLGGLGGFFYAVCSGQKGLHLKHLYGMLFLLGEILVIYHTFRGGGQMDYLNTCPVTIFWCMPSILLMGLRPEEKPARKTAADKSEKKDRERTERGR